MSEEEGAPIGYFLLGPIRYHGYPQPSDSMLLPHFLRSVHPSRRIHIVLPVCRRAAHKAGKFVKAHIIPEAFSRVMREDGAVPLLVTGTPNQFPKRSPIGIYDEGILCDECEPRFDRFDRYGIETLLAKLEDIFQPVSHQGEIVAYQADVVDQKLLLQFLVTTRWRASVSTHSFYHRISLGPFEEVAKRVILEPDKDVPEAFSAILSKWTIEEQHQWSIGGPYGSIS